MKPTKIKQIQGQASLSNFFKPKKEASQNVAVKAEEINPINPKSDLKIKQEESKLIESNSESKSNSLSTPTKNSNLQYDSNQTDPIVEDQKEDYIQNKLNFFKYSKKKSFQSKSKAKLGQNNTKGTPLNHKRQNQSLKWLRQTPSSKKKIKKEDDTFEQSEEKIASIYKQERLLEIELNPPEDNSKQNQAFQLEITTTQFDSKNEPISNHSRKSEGSKGSKSDSQANRQLQINDFRQFNSTLNEQKKIQQQRKSRQISIVKKDMMIDENKEQKQGKLQTLSISKNKISNKQIQQITEDQGIQNENYKIHEDSERQSRFISIEKNDKMIDENKEQKLGKLQKLSISKNKISCNQFQQITENQGIQNKNKKINEDNERESSQIFIENKDKMIDENKEQSIDKLQKPQIIKNNISSNQLQQITENQGIQNKNNKINEDNERESSQILIENKDKMIDENKEQNQDSLQKLQIIKNNISNNQIQQIIENQGIQNENDRIKEDNDDKNQIKKKKSNNLLSFISYKSKQNKNDSISANLSGKENQNPDMIIQQGKEQQIVNQQTEQPQDQYDQQDQIEIPQNKEIEENQKQIEAQTKNNEKNAQNMLKIFISHLESEKNKLNEQQKQNISKLKKIKPTTRNTYESQLKNLNLVEQYDEFINQFNQIQELKIKFNDYIEFMKLPKKKKVEIQKQINQIQKQHQSNFEDFQKSLQQNVDIYYSRFTKMQKISEDAKNLKENKGSKEEEQKKMEMKGKDSYRVINYVTQWDQKIEIHPTEEQLDIVVSDIKKDTKIIACAGSGKTTTLVLRLKYLLDHGVKPNQIIISTFNVEAGKHISQKVYEMIGKDVQASIIIGNIDKIAYKFIRSELEAKQKSSSSVILFSQREYCDLWLAHIKKYKFQYMQYKYFFFDEFQDVSELQYEILMEFKKLGCILTVIGDDAQNIYGFRDTKIDIIQNRIDEDLKKKKKDLQEFKLTANYRSTHAITMFANKIIEKNENLIKKIMESAQDRHGELEQDKQRTVYEKEGDYPYLHIFDSEKQQNEVIIRRILSMVKNKGTQFKDIAIIGPMNEQLKKFEEVIEKHNQKSIQSDQIPYQAFITLKFEEFKLIDYNSAPQRQNKLTISTIHRSKGLEWDIIYFLGCNDDQFPMAFVQKNKNQACTILEEQRRLFYVGATRAIKELNFCCIIKEPEKMSDKDKNQGKFKITRFFADIPRQYFRADIILDFSDRIMSDYKWIEFEDPQKEGEDGQLNIKIREVISQMSSKQLEDINIYTQNIIAEKGTKSLYMEKHEISQQVKDNQLFSEMGMFFDRCIIRMIGEKYDCINSFYNQVAAQVILPQIYELHLPENLFRLFLRYSKFFTTFDSAQLEDQRNVIERFEREGEREKSQQEIEEMKELHTILTYNAEVQCIKRIQMFNFLKHKPNRYFQDQFERLGQSYIIALSEYMNRKKKSEEIFENIYKISKCGFLYENRRKYLYNNNLTQILDYDLLKSIQVNFINGFLSQFQQMECKRIYKTKYISGLIDILANKSHLVFFKFDSFDQYKKEDFLNYLFAAAFLKVNNQIDIEQISVFNFLSGTVQTLDLTGWTQHEQFFNEIESIAKAQILQNVERNILKIIDQEEDKILNREQKDELKRILFQNLTPQQVQESIQNMNDNSEKKNQHAEMPQSNQIEKSIQAENQFNQYKEDQTHSNQQVSDNFRGLKDAAIDLEKQFSRLKTDNQPENENYQQLQDNNYDQLRKKIKFEDENHPALLFSETKIQKNNDFSMVGKRVEQELNNCDQSDNQSQPDKNIILNQINYRGQQSIYIPQMQVKEEMIDESNHQLLNAHECNSFNNQMIREEMEEINSNNNKEVNQNNCNLDQSYLNYFQKSSQLHTQSNLTSILHQQYNQIDIEKYLDLYKKYIGLKKELEQVKVALEFNKKSTKIKNPFKSKMNQINQQIVIEKSLPDLIQDKKRKFYMETKSNSINYQKQPAPSSCSASPIQNMKNNILENEDNVQYSLNIGEQVLIIKEEDDISNVFSEEEQEQDNKIRYFKQEQEKKSNKLQTKDKRKHNSSYDYSSNIQSINAHSFANQQQKSTFNNQLYNSQEEEDIQSYDEEEQSFINKFNNQKQHLNHKQ